MNANNSYYEKMIKVLINTFRKRNNQTNQENEMIVLSKKDQEVFVKALLNAPEPSAKLKAAAQRYKQKMGISSLN